VPDVHRVRRAQPEPSVAPAAEALSPADAALVGPAADPPRFARDTAVLED
jgi:hypothetical protein